MEKLSALLDQACGVPDVDKSGQKDFYLIWRIPISAYYFLDTYKTPFLCDKSRGWERLTSSLWGNDSNCEAAQTGQCHENWQNRNVKLGELSRLWRLSNLLFIKYSEEIIGLMGSQERVDRIIKKKHLVNEWKFCDLVRPEQFCSHQQGQDRAKVTSVLGDFKNPSNRWSLNYFFYV